MTNPNETPIKIGLSWFDLNILATQATATARIYRLGSVIFVAIWIGSLLNYGAQLYTGLTQCHFSDRLRQLIFEQLQSLSLSLSLSYYSKIHPGEPINSITREVNELKQVFNLTATIIAQSSTYFSSLLLLY